MLKNESLNIEDFNYFCFHSPFYKLVQKSFRKLLLVNKNYNED